ncbi:hypothetical protein AB0O47_39485 [Streptomyces noursei]|uniref:hypothetical protein n=1 Tax=Streptomyces noursei TaxID=1971 RepID=UPI00344D1E2D
MDYKDAQQLAETGLLFFPSDSRLTQKPDRYAVHREMAEALRVHPSRVRVPTLVIAPSHVFDQVWRALGAGTWSDNLKHNYVCLHSDGEVEFVPKT